MIGSILVQMMLLSSWADPEVDASQFAQIAEQSSSSLNTVVFVYEGGIRWVGPRNLGMTPEIFDEDFQGTYLYRADGAGLVDVYVKKADPTASIVRKKKSVLKGKTETIRAILDAKTPLDPARQVQFGEGSPGALTDSVSPLELFWTWSWKERGDLSRRNYTFQGWEEVEGHKCLRFQIDAHADGVRRDQDYRRFWIDLERNAHVVRTEVFTKGKLTTKTEISLFELPETDGKRIWLPARGRTAWYLWGDVIHDQPMTERTIEVVHGSARVNVELPDSLFTVRRVSALPDAGELSKPKEASESSRLRTEFEAQQAREPFRTDPISVRSRIDKNLAEADRQSKELEASSPARDSWTWTTAVQSLLVLLGVALLTGVTYWKWTER